MDTVQPTATMLGIGATSLVTITFTEAVTGFDNSAMSVANGTLSAVSSSDGGMTLTATLTPTAGVVDSTNIIMLNNAGVADITGNAGTGITNSGSYKVDTVHPMANALGKSGNKFAPQDHATRAEAVTALLNMVTPKVKWRYHQSIYKQNRL